ncbi:MAG: hypothetical protein CMA09_05775 [Euryarchaeota archaeon]|nr:hypothetical protein [Euryarchaeota archaeon]
MTSSMSDGATDHRGEKLPELSKSATKMRMDKLLSTPMPEFEGNTPGSPLWSNIAFWIARRILAAQYRTSDVTGVENLPLDRGNMCCAWHTNGLMDPLQMVLNHPNNFVMGGRHDLVTRPLLGWWTRKLAVQPVVRKAELLRGGCSEEEASQINGRSLMMLATGISAGFGCVLFPEGTSHDGSSMLRFRTGPFRTVFAAAALAKANNQPIPAIVPIGLHFRARERFRTDVWVEYDRPLSIEEKDIPASLVEAVGDGNWVEPPAENVFSLRDSLRIRLMPLTPNTKTWEEYDALHVMGHVESRRIQQPLVSWKEEVLAARAFRTLLQPKISNQDTVENVPLPEIIHPSIVPAKAVASILKETGLDGRDLNSQGLDLRRLSLLNTVKKAVRIPVFLAFLPLFLYSFTPQAAMGRILGDSTDEGLDARSSYHFLAAMFGSLMFWPFMALGIVFIEYFNHDTVIELLGFDWLVLFGNSSTHIVLARVVMFLLIFPLFWLSGRTSSLLWDDWCDVKRALRRFRMNSTKRQNLRGALNILHEEMDKL